MKKMYASMFLLIVMCIGVVTMCAQEAIKVFKPGDRVEMNEANDVLNDDRWIKGTVVEVAVYTDDGRIYSYRVKRDAAAGGYVQQFGNLARVLRPASGGEVKENPTVVVRPNVVKPSELTESDPGACSFDEYPQPTSAMKFSQTFIKDELYERYAFETKTGSLSSPLAVGLSFEMIQIKGQYANTVTVVPGRGAQRKQDGAPVNGTIYPFKAKYIVCKKYKNAVTRTRYESDFVCFKDKAGNWSCPVDSVPKITNLD